MSKYSELAEKFYERYERPVIEPYIMGFSGIDPPLKNSGSGVALDHEKLEGLLGGNRDGHYHLTKKELDALIELISEKYPPDIYANQVIEVLADEVMKSYEVRGQDVRR